MWASESTNLLVRVTRRLFVALVIPFLVVLTIAALVPDSRWVVPLIVIASGLIGGFVGLQRRLKDLTISDLQLIADIHGCPRWLVRCWRFFCTSCFYRNCYPANSFPISWATQTQSVSLPYFSSTANPTRIMQSWFSGASSPDFRSGLSQIL